MEKMNTNEYLFLKRLKVAFVVCVAVAISVAVIPLSIVLITDRPFSYITADIITMTFAVVSTGAAVLSAVIRYKENRSYFVSVNFAFFFFTNVHSSVPCIATFLIVLAGLIGVSVFYGYEAYKVRHDKSKMIPYIVLPLISIMYFIITCV